MKGVAMRRNGSQSLLPMRFWAILFVPTLFLLSVPIQTKAATINIVAFGTSNIYGKGVERGEDFPAKLELALRAKGYDTHVSQMPVLTVTPASACFAESILLFRT